MRAIPLLLLSMAAVASPIGPNPYLSSADSPFTGPFAYFHLEDFEDGALNATGLSASEGYVLPPAPLTDSIDGDDGVMDGFGHAGRSWYPNTSLVRFTFDAGALGALPTHVGAVWTDVGRAPTFGSSTIIFEAFDMANTSLGTIVAVLGDGAISGQTAEDRFFGWIHAGGISAIEMSMPGSVDWELDHIQYGREGAHTPEPSTLGLALAGLAAVVYRLVKLPLN